jgi:hypothetical protein
MTCTVCGVCIVVALLLPIVPANIPIVHRMFLPPPPPTILCPCSGYSRMLLYQLKYQINFVEVQLVRAMFRSRNRNVRAPAAPALM